MTTLAVIALIVSILALAGSILSHYEQTGRWIP